MTTNEKVARRKLSLLELAKELNNVSKACKLIGYSRQQFYEIRRRLNRPSSITPSPNHPMARCGSHKSLLCKGINVRAGGVRGVWQRHDLLSKHDRLLRLEKTHREQTIELSDEQIRLLEHFTTPENRWWSTPSSSARSRGLARCIYKPCWTATVAMPGGGSTPASCR